MASGIGVTIAPGTTTSSACPPPRRANANTRSPGRTWLNTCSAFEHDAGDLQARNEWQLRLDLVFALDHQDVGKIDAGSAHADPHLAGAERWGSPRQRPRGCRCCPASGREVRASHAPSDSCRGGRHDGCHVAAAFAAIALSSRRISLPVDVSGNVSHRRAPDPEPCSATDTCGNARGPPLRRCSPRASPSDRRR